MMMIKFHHGIVVICMITLFAAHALATDIHVTKRFLQQAVRRELEEVPTECTDEMKKLMACGTNLDACLTCFGTAVLNIPDVDIVCSELDQTVCTPLQDCKDACGNCYDDFLLTFDCTMNTYPEIAQCNLNCSSAAMISVVTAFLALLSLYLLAF